ncbi:MAG TPA: LTA synthase family protein [Steroidobacteraceae bacterium]|nr:LTA synthase family protein [Steroidobacteraceae bacterium]
MVERRPIEVVGGAVTRFVGLLPAFLLAMLCLRAAELGAGMPPGAGFAEAIRISAWALAGDAYVLARFLPLLLLLSLAPLLSSSRRAVFWSLGLLWSALVAVQAALIQYFITARVPLGADLYAYSLRDVQETVAAGLRLYPAVLVGTLLALLILWAGLTRSLRRERPLLSRRVAAGIMAAAVVLWLGPGQFPQQRSETQYSYSLRGNKAAYFLADSTRFLMHRRAAESAQAAVGADTILPEPISGFRYLDPRFPFLHAEQTPDDLSPHFVVHPHWPPNLVFLIVEGLGRSFSGPGASLGSFTPFLDKLAGQSLYWENFLSVQGRTFGALPSIFGSLPFGEEGFAALGEAMPAHATLLSVLKGQGYQLRYYAGTDLEFDNERAFLLRQGVDRLRERKDFGPGYVVSNEWGYGDNELVSLALADAADDSRQPFVAVLQTNSTHTPYTFAGQARYPQRFERRLDELGVAEKRKDAYRAYRDIYSSILYVDDVLRRYFDATRRRSYYANTIFIITGDHRLPELPLSEWIDRYHVPLIIFSPLLRAPLRIKSVSSDFDIAPSLLSFLSHSYGIRTPAAVTWIGSGLDLEPQFRNLHEFPMKQTKTNLVDFIAGRWLLSRDSLYALGDGLHAEPVQDAPAQARVEAQFTAFLRANDQFAHSRILMPPEALVRLETFDGRQRQNTQAPLPLTAAALAVREVRLPKAAHAGQLTIEVVFANAAARPSEPFVPLVVLQSADGRDLSETYGAVLTLGAGQTRTLRIPVKSLGLARGHYFLSVLPSHPATGKPVGTGRYHLPIVIEG